MMLTLERCSYFEYLYKISAHVVGNELATIMYTAGLLCGAV